MPDKDHKMPDKIPFGYPSFSSLQEFLTPERLEWVRNSPERLAFVKDLSMKLAREPVFLSSVEAMLREHGAELESKHITAVFELASFGWSPIPELPSPRAAAAAVAVAAAALVVPVPIPV